MAHPARRIGIRIDMTPMVDVAFLLLIFFMTTTQFKPPEQIAVKLPVSTSEMHVPETNTIILTVNKDGKFYISGDKASDTTELIKSDLVSGINTWRSKNPSAVVVLKGDRGGDFGPVADLIDALAESNTLRFNLMTDLRQAGKPGSAQ